MAPARIVSICLFFMWVLLHFIISVAAAEGPGLGINWAIQSSHTLSPSIVVNMLQANNISKVKLLEADPLILEALTGTHVNVMVGIPNQMLNSLSKSRAAARTWVHDNVTRYAFKGGVDIRVTAAISVMAQGVAYIVISFKN
ncbi:hypothetical protein KI387_037258, partial [Taxus chinensis]